MVPHTIIIFRSSNLTVRPEHIAILAGNITTDNDNNPVLTFYAQPALDRVISAEVLMRAVEVSRICSYPSSN